MASTNAANMKRPASSIPETSPPPASRAKKASTADPQLKQQPISTFFAPTPSTAPKPSTTPSASSAHLKPTQKPEPSTTSTHAASASKPSNPTDSSTPTLTLSHHVGDIFDAPPNTVLIHACNTQGSWGAGIAAAFRARYPAAYKRYRAHCLKTYNPNTNPLPTGTCFLIPPCEADPDVPRHWIGCLFTSAKYGKGKDKPNVILRNTGPAMQELLEQVKEANGKEGEEGVSGARMCKINSARFGVPWERTVGVLEGIVVEEGWMGSVEVWNID